MEQKRNYNYDCIKIMATFMVCFYHLKIINMGYFSDYGFVPSLGRLFTNLCAMSVPLFFMVNGALMVGKATTISKKTIRLLKMLFLYFFWMNVIDFSMDLVFNQPVIISFDTIISRGKYSTHLWFLLTLAIITFLLPVINWIYKKHKLYIYLLLLLLFIFPFLYNYALILGNIYDFSVLKGKSRSGAGTMYSLMYFMLGKIIADKLKEINSEKKKTLICFSYISLICGWLLVSAEGIFWTNIEKEVFDGVNSSFPTIGALLMASGVFVIFSLRKIAPNKKMQGCIVFLSSNMLGIYILHYIFTEVIKDTTTEPVSFWGACIITLGIILITATFSALCSKIPYIRFLFKI